MKKSLLIFFILFGITNILLAQDTIQLLSGRQIYCRKTYSNDLDVCYYKKSHKLKKINKDKVYSYTDSTKTTYVLYTRDTLQGFYLTKEQMKFFIFGEQHAMKECRTFFPNVISFITGAGAGIFGFYGLPVVFGVPFIVKSFNPKINKKDFSNKEIVNREFFDQGYRSRAKFKRFKNSMICGAIGFVVMGVVTEIMHDAK